MPTTENFAPSSLPLESVARNSTTMSLWSVNQHGFPQVTLPLTFWGERSILESLEVLMCWVENPLDFHKVSPTRSIYLSFFYTQDNYPFMIFTRL